jgi:hypothetical protein
MSAENAIIHYESAQSQRPFEAMTDSGDHTQFEAAASPWSGAPGFEPEVRPDGVATGGKISVDVGTDDSVAVAALTCYIGGELKTVSGGTQTVQRGSMGDSYRINSITVTSSGALAVVAGTEGSSFTEARGEAGGPPYIPVGSIEVGQVRLDSETAAEVMPGEIMQVIGLHQERTDYPVWEESFALGEVHFAEPLDGIHTGDTAKGVHVRYATPIFAAIPRSSDWTPAETSHSLSSTPIYGGAIGSSSASINQASFTAHLDDGIRDSFLGLKNQRLWFRFRPDRNRTTPYQLTQGVMGISRTFPADGGITASVTVTPEEPTIDVRE